MYNKANDMLAMTCQAEPQPVAEGSSVGSELTVGLEHAQPLPTVDVAPWQRLRHFQIWSARPDPQRGSE